MYQHEMKHLTQKWIDFKDSFTIATDKIHENSISVQVQSVIFISIFFYLYHIHWKISSLFCVSFCAVHLKREIHAVRLKKWKIYRKSTESRIIDVPPPFGPVRSRARQPAKTRSNPRWRKQKNQYDRRSISANFPHSKREISFHFFDFWRIRRWGVMTKTMSIVFLPP